MGLICRLLGHQYDQNDLCTRCGTARGSEGLKFKKTRDKQGYVLVSLGKCRDEMIVIPTYYNGKPVTAIGPHAFDGYDAELTLTIPTTITSIEEFAFARSGLRAIHLGQLTELTLGTGVFYECTALSKVTLPSTLTELPQAAFAGCNALEELTLPDSLTDIGRNALERCNSLRKLFCPDTVTTIGSSAFAGCSSLERLRLPPSLTMLSARLLADCSALTSLDIPATVTIIGDGALWGCTALKAIELPEGVRALTSNAFCDCTAIETFTFPASLVEFIPNDEGEGNVFLGCTSLCEVRLHTDFKHFPTGMFGDCTALCDIYLENGKSLDWRNIQKDEGFDTGSGEYVVHLVNGRIRKGS